MIPTGAGGCVGGTSTVSSNVAVTRTTASIGGGMIGGGSGMGVKALMWLFWTAVVVTLAIAFLLVVMH